MKTILYITNRAQAFEHFYSDLRDALGPAVLIYRDSGVITIGEEARIKCVPPVMYRCAGMPHCTDYVLDILDSIDWKTRTAVDMLQDRGGKELKRSYFFGGPRSVRVYPPCLGCGASYRETCVCRSGGK